MGLYAIEVVMFFRHYSVLLHLAQTIVPAQESFQHNRIVVHHEKMAQ
jgi:hypothetical protein